MTGGQVITDHPEVLSVEQQQLLHAWWRAANYL
jgi:hypothetical protein